MKTLKNNAKGFTLLEILLVIAIIGALTSIAIPDYLRYIDEAKIAACKENRRNIEMEERMYYSEHDKAGLKVDSKYSCPSGGVYVWLVSDPNDPEYPKVGCSIHNAGTPETPDHAIDWMVDFVQNLNLSVKITKVLTKRLSLAKKRYEKGQIKRADNTLKNLMKQIKKYRSKIADEDEVFLYSKIKEIRGMLKSK